MPGVRNVVHTDNELQFGSQYLRYHIRMYVETLLWLQDHPFSIGWDTIRNAMLEDHLVHARVLINFLSKGDSSERKNDVLAVDYFHDLPDVFLKLQDGFLNSQAEDIGSHLVHITKKPMPKLKSQQEWFIGETSSKLVPALRAFLIIVPETRLVDSVKSECLNYLAKLTPPRSPLSVSPTT